MTWPHLAAAARLDRRAARSAAYTRLAAHAGRLDTATHGAPGSAAAVRYADLRTSVDDARVAFSATVEPGGSLAHIDRNGHRLAPDPATAHLLIVCIPGTDPCCRRSLHPTRAHLDQAVAEWARIVVGLDRQFGLYGPPDPTGHRPLLDTFWIDAGTTRD